MAILRLFYSPEKEFNEPFLVIAFAILCIKSCEKQRTLKNEDRGAIETRVQNHLKKKWSESDVISQKSALLVDLKLAIFWKI